MGCSVPPEEKFLETMFVRQIKKCSLLSYDLNVYNHKRKDKGPDGLPTPEAHSFKGYPSSFWQLKTTLTALLALPSVRRNSLPLEAAKAEDLLLQLMVVKTARAKAKEKAKMARSSHAGSSSKGLATREKHALIRMPLKAHREKHRQSLLVATGLPSLAGILLTLVNASLVTSVRNCTTNPS